MKWSFNSDAQKYSCSLKCVNSGEVVHIDGSFYVVMAKSYINLKNYVNCVKLSRGYMFPFHENTVVEVYPNAKLNIN